jgi:TatD DNase family protein
MQLIDVGINLTHDSYDADRTAVIARATEAGVTQMLVTGASIAGNQAASTLAKTDPGRLFATAGVHPHHASDLKSEHESLLRELWRRPEVRAVGECGLDYFRDLSPRQDQLRAFERQLDWGRDCGKPLFLHQRDAHEDFVAVLRQSRAAPLRGVAHCFTGTETEMQACLELGLHIGISGWICDERRGLHLREIVRRIPPGRLLLETDGPYLLPRDLQPMPRSRRNEPAYLIHIAGVVAQCRGESTEACAAHTTAAARELFSL